MKSSYYKSLFHKLKSLKKLKPKMVQTSLKSRTVYLFKRLLRKRIRLLQDLEKLTERVYFSKSEYSIIE